MGIDVSQETKSQRKSLLGGHAGLKWWRPCWDWVPGLSGAEDLFSFLLHLCRVGQRRSGKESAVKGSVSEVTPEKNTEAECFKSRRRPRDFPLSEIRAIGTMMPPLRLHLQDAKAFVMKM